MISLNNFILKLLNYPRRVKQGVLVIMDILLIIISLWVAFVLRLGNVFPKEYIMNDWWLFILLPFSVIPFFIINGLYRAVLQYMGSQAIIAVIKSISFSTFA